MAEGEAIGLPGVSTACRLLRFDRDGACISPEARAALLAELAAGPARRVILISHGWNNDFSAATDLYARFMRQVEALGVLPDGGRDTLVVGIIWPSSWAPRDAGPAIAAAPLAPPDPRADPARMLLDSLDQPQRLRVAALLAEPALPADAATELAGHVAAALTAEADDPATEAAEAPPSGADVLAAMRALSDESSSPSPDTWAAGAGAPASGIGRPAAAGLLGLDPLMAVRVFSVYQMKDRAGRVGANGVAALLGDLLATGHPVHGVGHSYGCKVLLSALCGGPAPSRPVESLLLLEPAVSHLCFADTVPGRPGPGGYRAALREDHVRQPILSTFSRWDEPLHRIFHLALRRSGDLGELRVAAGSTRAGEPPSVYCALGGYGPRASGEALIDPLPRAREPYALPPGHRIYAFDGTLDRRIAGHGDVTTDLTAWAFAQQLAG